MDDTLFKRRGKKVFGGGRMSKSTASADVTMNAAMCAEELHVGSKYASDAVNPSLVTEPVLVLTTAVKAPPWNRSGLFVNVRGA
ncbi:MULTISPECIES: hypothetical protein [unclassified Streptomyces]|uniref:hypothetical protein n=1 Tax=unclassified Streptomyces TaxID=2593676 RepID=UPI0014880ABA|nr:MULTISPECIES: hypothetical protein [unclassified Streptomyces]